LRRRLKRNVLCLKSRTKHIVCLHQENVNPTAETMIRRFAANYIITSAGEKLRQYVAEIADGHLVRLYPLNGAESENVEWMLGAIQLVDEADGTVAYHLYPFDFLSMACVDGTQRTLLQ
jgi:hypothetical protein